ncbi:MAG: hypothetical protein ACYC7E_13040 [Armatimonadota bacterium]
MGINYTAPWHRASFLRLVHEQLPELLAARLPLAGYHAEVGEETTCHITVTLGAADREIELAYDLLQPDENGLFTIDDQQRVVVPTASSAYLEQAEIRCVGDQFYAYLAERLGEASADIAWDEAMARAWLPLDAWWQAFLTATAQRLDTTNWLAAQTHLRRIAIPDPEQVITSDQFGRVCPFETPEGPNIGHVFSMAVGAEIRDGRLIITDPRPESTLGLTASMVPFLEQNDPNRQLMGVNMMRQWMTPKTAEPALVQTGNEEAVPGFWCGYNLLTAFVSWGADTYEDGILISESCARKLRYDYPVEPGDKFSNRHGAKGVISRIVPDDEMPHLTDGTPVELVYNFIALHTRLNCGQLREAVASRIARATGEPMVVLPFQAPDSSELQRLLIKAGLPEDGMEQLTQGRNGESLERRSTVGWVYWGKTWHTTQAKIHASVTPEGRCQSQGELEYYALRDIGAFESIRETYNTRAAERPDAETLAARAANGPLRQADPPTPRWAEITRRLAAAGIHARLENHRLSFSFAAPTGETLLLAKPLPSPWLPEHEVQVVGALPELLGYQPLVQANTRLARLLASAAPAGLLQRAEDDVRLKLGEYFADLLTPSSGGRNDFSPQERTSLLRMYARVLFSGRTVLAVGNNLQLDQVGLPEEMAWTFFGPLVARDLGNMEDVSARNEKANSVLDDLMARSWVIINRAPTFMPTALVAFHPVRIPDRVIRLHPLSCLFLNADFDGDQVAVLLPLTEEGQREAETLISVKGHLQRDPALVKWLYPNQEMLWGLASRSLIPEGQQEVTEILPLNSPEGYVTREAVTQALRSLLQQDGVDQMLATVQRLMEYGFAATQRSGASLSSFAGSTKAPAISGEPAAWKLAEEQLIERLGSQTDFTGDSLGPQLLAVKSGARGSLRQLAKLIGPSGVVVDVEGNPIPITRGFRDGVSPAELFAHLVNDREGLQRTALGCAQIGYGVRESSSPKGFTVLVRAMRAEHPGIVFAHAAATGEVDPLTDVDSRLLVGVAV